MIPKALGNKFYIDWILKPVITAEPTGGKANLTAGGSFFLPKLNMCTKTDEGEWLLLKSNLLAMLHT